MNTDTGINSNKPVSGETNRYLIAVIGDSDTVTGFLLAGIGHKVSRDQSNFFVVDETKTTDEIENKFKEFITRNDIAMILISQPIADRIRLSVDAYHQPIPALLEIPTKEHPYDSSKDSIIKLANRIMGND